MFWGYFSPCMVWKMENLCHFVLYKEHVAQRLYGFRIIVGENET